MVQSHLQLIEFVFNVTTIVAVVRSPREYLLQCLLLSEDMLFENSLFVGKLWIRRSRLNSILSFRSKLTLMHHNTMYGAMHVPKLSS